ncbi:MAG: hypothetical protein KDN19_17040 [Verrucomicrobiae bacterium]|nr:hypothetical protein [Verrucomicrobiae bacterium]
MKPVPTDPRCPECGAPVHLNAVSCGNCGARRDERGWFRSADYDGIDLPEDDDDFDYEDFVAREFHEGSKLGFLHRMTTKQRFWWLIAVLTLIAFAWLSLVAI